MDNILSVMEEHMLHAVEVVENTGQYTFAEIVHEIVKDLDPSFEDHLAQVKELLVGDALLFETRGILRPTQRQVGTDILPEFFGKGIRCCVVPGGMQRMDL